MSIEALRYVKKLRKSPSGEDVTIREKAILWYLADSHNEAERAAWPSISTIAEENNLEERTVRDILKSCIVKRIVWRDDRKRENGSTTSNYWHFTAIDGEQPTRALIEEEKRQILGRKAAEKANQTKARKKFDSGNPQQACGEGCGIPQGADAESRIPGCGNRSAGVQDRASQGAESRIPAGAENRRGQVRNPASPDPVVDLAFDSAVDLAVDLSREPLPEALSAAAVEISGHSKSENQTAKGEQLWRKVLDSLIGVVGEPSYLQLCVKTKLTRAEMVDGVLQLDVVIPDAAYEALLVKHQTAINKTLLTLGFSRDAIRIVFVGPSVSQECNDAARKSSPGNGARGVGRREVYG